MIYIAAPFFNEEQLNFVKEIEKLLQNLRVEYYSPRSEGVLIDQTPEEKAANKRKIFQSNVGHIDFCSLVIAVIDDRDTGTIWEMGYAHAKEKPIITTSKHNYGLNVMIAESVQAHTIDFDQLTQALIDPTYTGEKIDDVF